MCSVLAGPSVSWDSMIVKWLTFVRPSLICVRRLRLRDDFVLPLVSRKSFFKVSFGFIVLFFDR